MSTFKHVADADDCREPFDWSEHVTISDADVECWCAPDVLPSDGEDESDDEYRRRLIDAYGKWGALTSEMIESNGSSLDSIGRVLHPPMPRQMSVLAVVHRRPIAYDIVTGEARVEARGLRCSRGPMRRSSLHSC